MLQWFFKMWNGTWNKLQLKVCQVAQASLAYLDKHLTLDPVMINVVSLIPPGGNFLLKFLKHLDANSGLKFIIVKNLICYLLITSFPFTYEQKKQICWILIQLCQTDMRWIGDL